MADRKISDLTALTTPATGDLIPIVDVSEAAAADKNKSITVGELLRGAPDGTAAAPGIAFESDGGNGMFLGGTDILAFSTGGTQAVTIDASQRLGVGTTSPAKTFEVNGTAALKGGSPYLYLTQTSATGQSRIYFGDPDTELRGYTTYDHSDDSYRVATASNERLRIDSSGRVGIGTSSPSYPLDLVGDGGISSTAATNSQFGQISIQGRNSAGSTSAIGRIKSYPSGSGNTSQLAFETRNSSATLVEAMRIDDSQRVGIGTTSVQAKFHVSNGGAQGLETDWDGSSFWYLQAYNRSTSSYIPLQINGSDIRLGINGSEKARIDSSGRLLVGTSSSAPSGTYSSAALIRTQGNSASSTNWGSINIARGQAATAPISANSDIGAISFSDNTGQEFGTIRCMADATSSSGDYPGRLVFSTTADGASSPTERLRINRDGRMYSFTSVTEGFHLRSSQSASTSASIITAFHSGTGNVSGGTVSFNVNTNGNVTNTNNSYGAISDIKLKENIVDAGSQWDDLKTIQVRNYNFKAETGQPTHTQLGVVAQEIELVSPGLVTESPDVDDEGNDLGTTTKSVNYSVLYMKAVKALQEAMERIETLEAKVAALEPN